MLREPPENQLGGLNESSHVLAGGVVEADLRDGVGDYEHDYSEGDFAYPDGRRVVEVGPKNTLLVRLSDIHELPQIRETIAEREIEDLAYKIIDDNDALNNAATPDEISAALDLMHPPEVLLLQPQELETFLEDHADFYELDSPVAISHRNQAVMLQNSGHRRRRAIEYIIVKIKGLSLQDVAMRCTVRVGMTFNEANKRQAKENSHVQTSAIEDAKNIIRQYKFIQRREGRQPTCVEIAKIYGCSDTKVRTALAFDSLPEAVKALVGNEKGEEQLPLSLLADLAPLRDLYDRRYAERMADDPEVYAPEHRQDRVAEEIEAFAIELAADKKVNKSLSKVYTKLAGERESVENGLTIPMEQFLLFEAKRMSPAKRREEAYRRFGANCLYGIELAASSGGLDDMQIMRLEQIVVEAKNLAQPSVTNTQETMF